MNTPRPRLWYVRLRTFADTVPWAIHYHVALEPHDNDSRIDVEWLIDKATATAWNRDDSSYRWHAGDQGARFNTRSLAIQAAIAVFRSVGDQERDLLIVGEPGYIEAGEPIAGAPDLVARCRALWENRENSGTEWWDWERATFAQDERTSITYGGEHGWPERTEFVWDPKMDREGRA